MNRAIRPLTLAVVGVTAALVAAAPTAAADPGYYVFGTEIGIYPRVEPNMDSAKTGVALADGTPLDIACQTTGVPFGGNAIFNRLADGTYLPDYFTYTGVDGFDPRLPRCGDTPAPTEPVESEPTSSWVPFCGASKYVEKIEVNRWPGGQFRIFLTPTSEARDHAARAFAPRANPYDFSDRVDPRDAVVEQWHAIQGCVPGLDGDLADSIWLQLECHQYLSYVRAPREGGWLTGSTYDLESWRPEVASRAEASATQCMNTLGNENAPTGTPNAGELDLHGALSDIA